MDPVAPAVSIADGESMNLLCKFGGMKNTLYWDLALQVVWKDMK